MHDLPYLGVGLAYRPGLHEHTVRNRKHIDWLEVMTDEYIGHPGGLDEVRNLSDWPICCHGLEMSIGSEDALDHNYVDRVAAVADAVDAPWVSDHLCFTREAGVSVGGLTPVERTRERAKNIAAKARHVQDRLGRPFLLENITYYFDLPGELSESELINEVFENCDCGILLDLNNLALNAYNHQFDPYEFLAQIPLERVVEVHLAGNSPEAESAGIRLDGHDAAVGDDVFALLKHVTAQQTVKAVLIERDDHFPEDFGEIVGDLTRARTIVEGTSAR